MALDVDNIVKPIQDAIIGLAYVDDDQVTDVLCMGIAFAPRHSK
ncbi:MAG: RusA family crossover junction endodeoxyribonuclease [Phormidesmis sp. CAN_BIN36]|nr:RusA family crossover junction endodeoxyribonuclease [Phormidesmis sp. CAN_BIN36]